nr:DegT/DnrJ/EryC1/StrS family aminotransferase [Sphingomonas sp. Y57]
MTDIAVFGGKPIFDKPLNWFDIWPPVTQNGEKALLDLYRSRQWSAFFPHERVFAEQFARHHQSKHGVFMANGTVTLQCALKALDVGPGDEVIVPALTWCATATAVHYLGATPVFVDIDAESLCLDPALVEAAITPRTRAIIPVHLYGAMADMPALLAIARRHDLRIVEDCAHMHGGLLDGRSAGSMGDVGSFSFQHSKTMASAEGGICITNDDAIAERIFRLSHIGYGPNQQQGAATEAPPPGMVCYPFRATAFQALILQDQLTTLNDRLVRYGQAVEYLEERLSRTTAVRFQKRAANTDRQGYFGWAMIFDHPDYRAISMPRIKEALVAEGVTVLPTWGPVYDYILFNLPRELYRIPAPCDVAHGVSPRMLWLIHPYLGLAAEEIEKIAEAIERVCGQIHRLVG